MALGECFQSALRSLNKHGRQYRTLLTLKRVFSSFFSPRNATCLSASLNGSYVAKGSAVRILSPIHPFLGKPLNFPGRDLGSGGSPQEHETLAMADLSKIRERILSLFFEPSMGEPKEKARSRRPPLPFDSFQLHIGHHSNNSTICNN